MIKIEDVFTCINGNWEVYKALLEKEDFVPVVGAGLSMDMGVVGWDEMLISLAEYVFNFGKTGGKTDDELEKELDPESISLIEKSLDKLKEFDEKDTKKPKQKEKNVRERIGIIKKFVLDSENSGEKAIDLKYVFFKKLLNREAFFSSYEAAELLKIANDDNEHLMWSLYYIINKSRQESGWKIEKDKAVYWLGQVLRILRKSKSREALNNIADCFTTNYDDILEEACLKEHLMKEEEEHSLEVKIEHLHGYFDAQERPHDICLTLSDLLDTYQDKLNGQEARINSNRGIYLMESGNTALHFLFLGTSFSEGHIGQLARPRSSYGIVPLPNNVCEMPSLQNKMKKFMIGKHTTLFYPVEEGNHKALAILMHQFARDLSGGLWNTWFFIEHFPKKSDNPTNEDVQKVNEAIEWLKDSGRRILVIKKGENLGFNVDNEEGELIYNNSGILFFISEKLKEEFKRPEWSEYCEIESIFTKQCQEDPEPLGNTIYIYRKEGEFEEHWMKFKRQIKDWYSEEGRKGWEYKIVRFKLSYDERKEILDRIEERAQKLFRRKRQGNRVRDIELSPIYDKETWKEVMNSCLRDAKLEDIKKDDKEYRNVNLSSQDDLREEIVAEKLNAESSYVGNPLEKNNNEDNKKENGKSLTKKLS